MTGGYEAAEPTSIRILLTKPLITLPGIAGHQPSTDVPGGGIRDRQAATPVSWIAEPALSPLDHDAGFAQDFRGTIAGEGTAARGAENRHQLVQRHA